MNRARSVSIAPSRRNEEDAQALIFLSRDKFNIFWLPQLDIIDADEILGPDPVGKARIREVSGPNRPAGSRP